MKLTTFLPFLPLALAIPTSSLPVTNANLSPLIVSSRGDVEHMQAANLCFLHNEAIKFSNLGCDHDPFTGRRKEPVNAAGRYQVSCYALGKSVTWTFETYGTITSGRWGFVPAMGCWIWAPFLQDGCLSKFLFSC